VAIAGGVVARDGFPEVVRAVVALSVVAFLLLVIRKRLKAHFKAAKVSRQKGRFYKDL
jgi:Na+-transporting NADH:ubiquinone oxidoreductase subunit NqrD